MAGDCGRFAINLSGHSIGDPDILAIVRGGVDAGLEPGNVIFEIPETAALGNIDASRAFAQTLHELGCEVALDDFGTGFGTFTYLKHLPAEYLKIDTEFVRDVAESRTDQQVVKSIVDVAHSLAKATIAEGVETAAALAELRRYGVDYVQGFYLGPPAPLSAPTELERAVES
jgi:EAL domain-containing protein (putative c-di-GMP-specific phosphodiesterase class I)